MLPEGKGAVNEIKYGHSLSLDGHSTTTKFVVPPRSSLLAKARSTPKLPVDTSYEAVQENINRKLIHSEVYNANPTVFRRVAPEGGCSHYVQQKHLMRDLLPTMHPISDPKDLHPPKYGYNFPRIPKDHSELHSTVEDFIQPKTLTARRNTGYNRGHIRSILDLDTFGPHHSQVVTYERLSGSLPISPNIDRNHSPVGSRSGRSGRDDDLDRTSNSSITSLNKSQSVPGLLGGKRLDPVLYSEGTGRDFEHPLLQTTTEGFSSGHDSRGASLKYSSERTRQLKNKKAAKESKQKCKLEQKRQQTEAKEYQEYVSVFETNLESTRSYF